MSSPLDGNGVAAAEAAFNASINNPQMVPCSKCEGRGYHHGFGEDGNDPDWCTECGGNQFNVVPGEETRAIEAAIAAYLASAAPSQTAVEPVGELVRKLLSYCMDWNDEPMADAEEPRVMPYCGELREAASTLTAQAAALVAAEANAWPFGKRPNPVCGHTQGEFAVYGDEASIKKVRAAIHELDAMMSHRIERIKHEQSLRETAETEVATLKARIAELEAGLDAAEAYNEEHGDPADTLHHGRSVLAHARRRTHQEKNNAG